MQHQFNRRALVAVLAAGLAGGALPHTAFAADDYPTQAVSLIVPNGPGGPSDVVGRLTAEALGEALGGSVIVENRPGAGGLVGTEIVARSPADGYTLLFSSNSAFSVLPALRKDLPFDVSEDITVVGTVATGPQALYVRASLGVDTVEELIERAKAEPGKLNVVSTGTGSVVHMAGELFKYHAGIDVVAIPYASGGEAVVAMLGGEVDMMVNDLSAVRQHIEAGTIKALAVSNDERIPELPDTPTFAEAGLPEVVTASWFAIGAPSKTPPEIVAKLNAALKTVLASDAFREKLAVVGMVTFDLSQEEASAFIAGELAKWQTIVDEADIKVQ